MPPLDPRDWECLYMVHLLSVFIYFIFECRVNYIQVRELDGIALILDHTTVDENNPCIL